MADKKCEYLTDRMFDTSPFAKFQFWQVCTKKICTCKDVPDLARQVRENENLKNYNNQPTRQY